MNSYAHLDNLRQYYELRAAQCHWIAHARRLIWQNRKHKDQSACIYSLLLWYETKYEADEMMDKLSKHWPRLSGQMNGKQGEK